MTKTRSLNVFLVSALSIATGCIRMPYSATTTADESPSIVISGAPEGAVLVVDDLNYGPANAYSGEQALRLRPGTHVVEVRSGGRTMLRQEIFLGSDSTKTLIVPHGEP